MSESSITGQTTEPRAWTGVRTTGAWALLTVSLVLGFLAIWVVTPAPVSALLPFGVAVPELSPALGAIAVILATIAWFARARRPARAAAGVAVAAALLFAVPLAQLPSTIRRFDAAMTAAGFDARLTFLNLTFIPAPGPSAVRRGVNVDATRTTPLVADIYAREGVRDAPLLVQLYGGAWQRGAPGDDELFARHFAALGYVVAAIDYRHAPAARWPAQIDDVRASLAWLRAHARELGADPARLVLVGRSAGAQLALVAAYQDGAPAVAGVVSLYGPVFLADGWREPPHPDPLGVRSILETYLGGTPDDVPDRYEAASPVSYLTSHAPPTLLVYGTRDHIVDVRFARRLEARLHAAGVRAALLEIPWAEHAFDVLPHGLSARLARFYTERFLAAVVGPVH